MGRTVTFYVEELVPAPNQPGAFMYQFVPRVLDVEDDFQIDEANLEGELCRMGQLIAEYGEVQAALKASLARREETADVAYAQAFLRYQQHPPEGTKPTVDSLKALATADPVVAQAKQEMFRFQEEASKIDNYFKAIIKKCDCLTALTYKQKAEYQRGDR